MLSDCGISSCLPCFRLEKLAGRSRAQVIFPILFSHKKFLPLSISRSSGTGSRMEVAPSKPFNSHPPCDVSLAHFRCQVRISSEGSPCNTPPHLTHLFYPLFFLQHSYLPEVYQYFILFDRSPILPCPTSAPSFNRISELTRHVL